MGASNFACGQSLTYGGESYPTVKIGAQCWFGKNLDIGTKISGSVTNQADANGSTIQKWCYNNYDSLCAIAGGLYQWHTAMGFPQICDNHDTSSPCLITNNHQGICPNGWHIPSDADWHTLEAGLSNPPGDTNCDPNRFNNGASSCSPAGTALQTAPFNAFLGGNGSGGGSAGGFGGWGLYSYFFSTLTYGPGNLFARSINLNSSLVTRTHESKFYDYSIRCLKN